MPVHDSNKSAKTSPDGEDITTAAARWFARRANTECWSGADETAFQSWLQVNPQHQREFEIIHALHHAAGQRLAETHTRPRVIPFPRRNFVLAAVAVAVLLLGLATWLLPDLLNPGTTYTTATGELRTLALADGSRVEMDAGSTIYVRFRRSTRLVELQKGRALFAVQSSPGRPFIVSTVAGTVQVVGTQFEVGLSDHDTRTRVAVLEGKVRLQPKRGSGDIPLLTAGQAALFAADGLSGPVVPVTADSFAAWRQGWLVFENRPLADVTAELARYRKIEIRIADAQLRDTPVSGSFRAGEPDGFFTALEQMLPVKVRRLSAAQFLIEPAATARR